MSLMGQLQNADCINSYNEIKVPNKPPTQVSSLKSGYLDSFNSQIRCII